MFVVVLTGCVSRTIEVPSATSRKTDESLREMYCGVVFRGESQQFRFPFAELELETGPIGEIHTSCECASAQVVEYLGHDGVVSKALELTFREDSIGNNADRLPMDLLIIITITFSDGSTDSLIAKIASVSKLADVAPASS